MKKNWTRVTVAVALCFAFVAGYAFAGGARKLWLVRAVEEAQALRRREPTALLAGEIGGRLISGFDLNNSPTLMASTNVYDRVIIQRAGDVIPQVLAVRLDRRPPGAVPYVFPETCPACGSAARRRPQTLEVLSRSMEWQPLQDTLLNRTR